MEGRAVATGPDDLAGIVDVESDAGGAAGECPESCHHVVLPEERMESNGRVYPIPDDLACVVNSVGVAVSVTWKGPQVGPRAILPEQGMNRTANANDLAGIVNAVRKSLILEFRHDAILPQEGPKNGGTVIAISDDLAGFVDVESNALSVTEEGPEVRHRAILPEEGVIGALAHDLARVVDPLCETRTASG